jgi:hypothetical protein
MVFYGSVSDGDDVQETVTGNDTLPNTKCTNIFTHPCTGDGVLWQRE